MAMRGHIDWLALSVLAFASAHLGFSADAVGAGAIKPITRDGGRVAVSADGALIAFDRRQEVIYGGEGLNREAAAEALERLPHSWMGTDLRAAVREGMRTLDATPGRTRELYIVSDFQRLIMGLLTPKYYANSNIAVDYIL